MTKTQETLLDTVRRSRAAIREHRDQIGDYRCWVDDEVLYHSTLPELNDLTPEPPDINEFMRRCEAYHSNRQDPSEPKASIPMDSSVGPLPLIYSPELDADLIAMTSEQLRDELDRLWEAIRVHRSIGPRGSYLSVVIAQPTPPTVRKTNPDSRWGPGRRSPKHRVARRASTSWTIVTRKSPCQ
jgi:hypothetical protein